MAITPAQAQANKDYLAGKITTAEYTRKYFASSATPELFSKKVQQKYGFGEYDQLRDYGTKTNNKVDYNKSTKNVTLGTKTYTPKELQDKGGVLSNDSWVLPKATLAEMVAPPVVVAPPVMKSSSVVYTPPTPAPVYKEPKPKPAPLIPTVPPPSTQPLPPAPVPDWVPSNQSTNNTIVHPREAQVRSQAELNQLKFDRDPHSYRSGLRDLLDDNPNGYRQRLKGIFDKEPAPGEQRYDAITPDGTTEGSQSELDKLMELKPRKRKAQLDSLLTTPKKVRSTLLAP